MHYITKYAILSYVVHILLLRTPDVYKHLGLKVDMPIYCMPSMIAVDVRVKVLHGKVTVASYKKWEALLLLADY